MKFTQLEPFGLIVHADGSSPAITEVAKEAITELLDKHLVVAFRGFSALEQDGFVRFAKQFGPLLQWDFGEVLHLKIQDKPANHLFTPGRVELHWDGAYLGPQKTPHYNVFQCLESSSHGGGGETLFVNSVAVWERASADEKALWDTLTLRYETEKKAHFGGTFLHPLIAKHPLNGKKVVRYIEAFNEDNADINPVQISVDGLPPEKSRAFLEGFTRRLYQDDVLYRHVWQRGDFLMVENHSLLHGRSRFHDPRDARHLQRIHVL